MTPMPRSALRVLALTAASILLVACGDGDGGGGDASPPDTDADVAVVGQDTLQWSSNALEAEAGEISVALTCEGGVNHNIVIDDTGEQVAECTPGETDEGTVELDAGEYTFVCTIPGHERSMRGTLTVS
jgi:plastocyanin